MRKAAFRAPGDISTRSTRATELPGSTLSRGPNVPLGLEGSTAGSCAPVVASQRDPRTEPADTAYEPVAAAQTICSFLVRILRHAAGTGRQLLPTQVAKCEVGRVDRPDFPARATTSCEQENFVRVRFCRAKQHLIHIYCKPFAKLSIEGP
jgi:hypothetical protein